MVKMGDTTCPQDITDELRERTTEDMIKMTEMMEKHKKRGFQCRADRCTSSCSEPQFFPVLQRQEQMKILCLHLLALTRNDRKLAYIHV